MKRELIWQLAGLAAAGVIVACGSSGGGGGTGGDATTTTTGGGSPPMTTGMTTGGGQGGVMTAVGGGGGAGGAGGAGGGLGCGAPAPQGGPLDPNQCGGSAASSGNGGFTCISTCDDTGGNTYEVECTDTLCSCKYNGMTLCTCPSMSGLSCSDSCCPDPWPHGGGGGAGGAGSSVVTAVAGGGN